MQDTHLVYLATQLSQTLLDDAGSSVVEVFFRGFQPLFDDGTVEFLHFVVVGQQFCTIGLHLHVDVREHGICFLGEFCNHLADGALDLLDGLLRGFHIVCLNKGRNLVVPDP